MACTKNNSDIVELLLNDPRMDPNICTNNKWSPFGATCFNGNIKTVKILLNDERIDPNSNWDPLLFACENNRILVVSLYLEDSRVIPCKPNEKFSDEVNEMLENYR